jgi:hypothetical protein
MTDWDPDRSREAGFGQPETRDYTWHARYTTREYLDLLQTHSDHAVLPSARRDALLGAICSVIDAHGGAFDLPYTTRLLMSRLERSPG